MKSGGAILLNTQETLLHAGVSAAPGNTDHPQLKTAGWRPFLWAS